MTPKEMATLLAKVQLGDNRNVDRLTVEYWMDTIGELAYEPAIDALRRFRREQPGTYLEPGHLLELAGVVDAAPSPWQDITDQVIAESKARALEAAGVTEAEYEAHAHDVMWIARRFGLDTAAGIDETQADEGL